MRLKWRKKIRELERIANERYWPMHSQLSDLEYRLAKLEAQRDAPKAVDIIEANPRLQAFARAKGWPDVIAIIEEARQTAIRETIGLGGE
ncbi:MAG: hypothetical protein ABIG61_12060 [Planctomycetota bacterium]